MRKRDCFKCGTTMFVVEKGKIHNKALAICQDCYDKFFRDKEDKPVNECYDALKNIFNGGR